MRLIGIDTPEVEHQVIYDGYAHEYTYAAPYRYQRQFREAERSARQGDRGLWSASTCDGDTRRPG